jgi:hypothetical protein
MADLSRDRFHLLDYSLTALKYQLRSDGRCLTNSFIEISDEE